MTVADWKTAYDQQVRPLMPWLPEADFELTPNNENRAYYRGLSAGRSQFYVPDHFVEVDLLKHEAGHAAHDAAAHMRDAADGHGTAGVDIWREVAAIVSPGVTWPTSGPDLRDEWTAEAFRKAIGGDLAVVRYPDPPGVLTPYPVAALLTYFRAMEVAVPQVDYPGAVWRGSPNFSTGRPVPVSHVVEHWTVGSAASAIARFLNADFGQPGGRVSAHYMVQRDGTVIQFVREDNTAWHDGQPGWNDKAIGIEHEHIPGQDWPDVQLAASHALHQNINSRRGIPLTHEFCLGHNATGYATACPGDLPIDTIIGEDMDQETKTYIDQKFNELNQKIDSAINVSVITFMRRMYWNVDPFIGTAPVHTA